MAIAGTVAPGAAILVTRNGSRLGSVTNRHETQIHHFSDSLRYALSSEHNLPKMTIRITDPWLRRRVSHPQMRLDKAQIAVYPLDNAERELVNGPFST